MANKKQCKDTGCDAPPPWCGEHDPHLQTMEHTAIKLPCQTTKSVHSVAQCPKRGWLSLGKDYSKSHFLLSGLATFLLTQILCSRVQQLPFHRRMSEKELFRADYNCSSPRGLLLFRLGPLLPKSWTYRCPPRTSHAGTQGHPTVQPESWFNFH